MVDVSIDWAPQSYGGLLILFSDVIFIEISKSPVESPQQQNRHAHQRAKAHKKSSKPTSHVATTPEPIIPLCSCGAARVFELQILPSLLHVLGVDKTICNSPGLGAVWLNSNAMNWGNIVVYTCPNPLCTATDEYVLVQQSVDEEPIVRPPNASLPDDVVIQEDAQFADDDDDDGDEDDQDHHDEDSESDEDMGAW